MANQSSLGPPAKEHIYKYIHDNEKKKKKKKKNHEAHNNPPNTQMSITILTHNPVKRKNDFWPSLISNAHVQSS